MIALLGLSISYMTFGCAFVNPDREHKSQNTPVDSGARSQSKDTVVDFEARSKSEDTLVASEADSELECVRIVQSYQAGEYKTVVDIADELNKVGYRCSEEVIDRIHLSRSKLKKADVYVLKSKDLKKEGKLLSALSNLQKALEIYPKYYWAQNLLEKIERSIDAEVTGLQVEASHLESKGDLEGALSLVQDSIALSPDDQDLKSEAARLQEAVDRSRRTEEEISALKVEASHLESKGDLEGALLLIEKARVLSPVDRSLVLRAERLQAAVGKSLQEEKDRKKLEEILTHKDAGDVEEAEKILEKEAPAKRLGKEDEARLNTMQDEHRQSLIREGLVMAREAEQQGNLEAAAEHTMYILKLSSAGGFLSSEIVEFTRLLGMKLFSAGNFSKARDLWEGALRLSPGNSKLQKYLAEVEESLDNLKKIRKEESNRVEE